jgi:hypothetical protein
MNLHDPVDPISQVDERREALSYYDGVLSSQVQLPMTTEQVELVS